MEEQSKTGQALQRLVRAIEVAQHAEEAANRRTMTAAASIVDSRAQVADARAQAARADCHMEAAKARMAAADAAMDDVEHREDDTEREVKAARFHRDEYERALDHYQQLVRHRIANPLQIILGMASTLLRDIETIDPQTRNTMLEAIEAQAKVLENTALFDPASLTAIEHDLHGEPDDSTEHGSVTQFGDGNVNVQGDVQGDVDIDVDVDTSSGERGPHGRRGKRGKQGKRGPVGPVGPKGS